MKTEADRLKDDGSVYHGFILLDEMSVQEDLQVVKKGDDWQIVGSVDLGPLVNNLDNFFHTQKGKLATHCFQYMYVSYSGFRWPVCYFASDNVNGHSIYLTLWPLISKLQTYGFNVHAAIMDGSSNNRQFMRIVVNSDKARLDRFTTRNPFNVRQKLILVQDIKHCFKKLRNSILSSGCDVKSKRKLMWRGYIIIWEHFVAAYKYNCKGDLRIYRKLTKEHIELNAQAKM